MNEGSGVDGLSFFLVDGTTTTFSLGGLGGALGYGADDFHDGLSGGWLGIGLDAFGNYDDNEEELPGIGLRGSTDQGTPWIAGTLTLEMDGNFIDFGYRRVRVTLGDSTSNSLVVEWDADDDGVYDYTPINISLDDYPDGISSRPSTLKFGFAASTGAFTNIHAVDWMTITTLATTGPALTYVEGSGAVAVNDSNVFVSAPGSQLLTGATVTITGYVAGQDELLFTDQTGIAGSWNVQTGVLTLSGTTSAADYQAAFQAVQFRNTSSAPSTDPRRISYEVTDVFGQKSDPFTLDLTVESINEDPTVSVFSSPPVATVGEGYTFSVAEAFTDPDGDALTYTASDLPAGLVLNATTGVIGGTPTTAGSISVVVTATATATGSRPAVPWF